MQWTVINRDQQELPVHILQLSQGCNRQHLNLYSVIYLSLRVVEVGRNSDDSVFCFGSQVIFCNTKEQRWCRDQKETCDFCSRVSEIHTCSLLHFHEDKGSSLTGRVHFTMSLHPSITIGCTHNLVRHVLPVKLIVWWGNETVQKSPNLVDRSKQLLTGLFGPLGHHSDVQSIFW